jgi:hypothetical protein
LAEALGEHLRSDVASVCGGHTRLDLGNAGIIAALVAVWHHVDPTAIEPRKTYHPGCRHSSECGRHTDGRAIASARTTYAFASLREFLHALPVEEVW